MPTKALYSAACQHYYSTNELENMGQRIKYINPPVNIHLIEINKCSLLKASINKTIYVT